MKPTASAGWERARFIRRFVHHPRTVGAIAPSSRWLAAAMVEPIRHRLQMQHGMRIIELGAGTGAFTRAIVAELRVGDRFVSVEIEPEFVAVLRQRWTNVDFACASAESLEAITSERRFGPADHIISGLPFATLPTDTTLRIVQAIGRTLRPGGTFTTFHYLHSYSVPKARAFRRQMGQLLSSTPERQSVAWNFPPAVALTWTDHRQ